MSSRSKFGFRGAKRTSAIAVLTAVIATTASALAATPAAAATPATSVSIDAASLNTNTQVGGTVVLDVSYSPNTATSPIYWTTISGPATNPATPAFPGNPTPYPGSNLCTPNGAGHVQCSITNGGTVGTNGVNVFADNNLDAAFNAGDVISGATTAIFSGKAATVTLAPATSTSTTDTCVLYTLHAVDSLNQPVVARDFTIAVTETSATSGHISFYNTATGCENPATSTGPTTASPIAHSVDPVTTLANGSVTFGIASSAVGTGQVKATADDVSPALAGSVSNTATVTWTAGGADSVTTLTAVPTSDTKYISQTSSFKVTATDHNNNPVQGVPVRLAVTTGPDAGSLPNCGTTNHLGAVTCNITNGGSPGTDILTIWVDNGLPGLHTTGQDANEPAVRPTAVFQNLPTYDSSKSKFGCIQQLAGPNKGLLSLNCTVPTTQQSVAFTQTLLTSDGAPVVGARIDFFVAGGSLGGGATANPASATVPTDATGTATFTVTNPTPVDGDFFDVAAFLGTTPLNGGLDALATWHTPVPSTVSVTPALQSVTKGSQVSVAVQVADQFGTPVVGVKQLSFSATGTPDSINQNPVTNASGAATITYTSSAISVGEDTLTVIDTTDGPVGQAFVEFVTGAPTASTVTVDTTGNGTSTVCPSTTGTPNNTNLQVGISVTPICVVVKNSNNEVLAGKSVTITVSTGQIAATTITSTSTATLTATTSKLGIATAVVTSTKSGTQTVTATADGVSGSGTLTYAVPGADKARNVSVSPTSANIVAGAQQKFTWTVIDQYGNPVGGATLIYTQAGAGLAGATSSGTLLTGPDGTSGVVVTTTANDNGAGNITATLVQPTPPTPLNQCTSDAQHPITATSAGNCTASATYTVVNASAPATLTLKVKNGVKKGNQETITATVKNANGTPAANQVVRFLVTGANGLIGSSLTNASGVATLTYLAKHAGTDTISAYLDINNDQAQQGNEPGKHTKAIIGGVTEHPSIRLTSKHGSVTVHVGTRPALARDKVTYYVKRYGAFHKIGTSKTGILGHAKMTFFFPKGVVRKFKAKVAGQAGIAGGKTRARTITVR